MAPPQLSDLPQAISKQCRTPLHWVVVRDDGSVWLKPDADANFKKVSRVIKTLRSWGIKYGAIGNGAWSGVDPYSLDQILR